MDNNFSIGYTINDAELIKKVGEDTKVVKQLDNAVGDAAKSFKSFDDAQKGTITAISGAKKELAKLQKQITDLTLTYASLSDAEKKAQFGQDLSRKLDELKNKAAKFKDAVADVQQEIKNLSSDTQITDGLNMLFGTLGNLSSAAVALTGDSKSLETVLKDLAKIQTTVRAIQSLTTALQAQNRVLLTNPYVLVAAAIAGLGVAISKVLTIEKQQREQMIKDNRLIKDQKDAYKTLTEQISKVVAEKRRLRNISKEQAKEDLEDSKNSLTEARKELARLREEKNSQESRISGLEYQLQVAKNSHNASRVGDVQAQLEAARRDKNAATAAFNAAAKLVDATKEQVKAAQTLYNRLPDTKKETGGSSSNSKEKKKNAPEAGSLAALQAQQKEIKELLYSGKVDKDSEEWRDLITANKKLQTEINNWIRQASGEDEIEQLKEAISVFENDLVIGIIKKTLEAFDTLSVDQSIESESLFKLNGDLYDAFLYFSRLVRRLTELGEEPELKYIKPASTSNRAFIKGTYTEDEEITESSFREAISLYKDLLSNLNFDDDFEYNSKAIQRFINYLENSASDIFEKTRNYSGNELEISKKEISRLSENLSRLSPGTSEYKETLRSISAEKDKYLSNIELYAKADGTFGSEDYYNKFIRELEDRLGSTSKSLNPKLYDELTEKIKALREEYDKLYGVMDKSPGLYGKQWREIMKNTEAADKASLGLAYASEQVSQLGSAFGALGSEFDSKGLNIASVVAQAIAQIAMGVANALASPVNGVGGVWSWIAASVAGMSTLAATVAQIHSITGYAEGGIIAGNRTIGDFNLARVNSGEMILNSRHQQTLWRAIDSGELGSSSSKGLSGKVVFKISGTELKGVLQNFDKKKSKI